MGKFDFGEVVEVGNDAVEFGAEFGSGDFVSDSVGMAAESDFCGEVIEFGGGADEFGGTIYDRLFYVAASKLSIINGILQVA